MTLAFSARRAGLGTLDVPLLVLPLGPDAAVNDGLAELDAALGGAISRSLSRRDFRAGSIR